MKRIILLALFISIASSGFGQARGYLGKKTFATYSLDFMPIIGFPHGVTTFESSENDPFIDLKHTLQFNRCISRIWVFTAGISYQNTPMKRVGTFSNDYLDYYETIQDAEHRVNYDINTIEINTGFRWYPKILAPVGRYYGMRLGYAMSSSTYDFTDYYNTNGQALSTNANQEVSASTLRFNFDIGATRVIDSKFILEYGVNFGINLYSKSGIGSSARYMFNLHNERFNSGVDDASFFDFVPYEEAASMYLPAVYGAHGFILVHFAFGIIM